jgi:hypothetical protein
MLSNNNSLHTPTRSSPAAGADSLFVGTGSQVWSSMAWPISSGPFYVSCPACICDPCSAPHKNPPRETHGGWLDQDAHSATSPARLHFQRACCCTEILGFPHQLMLTTALHEGAAKHMLDARTLAGMHAPTANTVVPTCTRAENPRGGMHCANPNPTHAHTRQGGPPAAMGHPYYADPYPPGTCCAAHAK